MKKSDFVAVLLLACLLPVQLFAKQGSVYQTAPEPVYIRPLIRVTADSNQAVLNLPRSFDFTPVWRISLRNLGSERAVVNNLSLNAFGTPEALANLSAQLTFNDEPLTENIENFGEHYLFFEDIYVVLMPGQTKDLYLKVASLRPIVNSSIWFNLQADGFTGFSTRSVDLDFTGQFPYVSQAIQIGNSDVFSRSELRLK